jgi:hypothetical protein
LGKGTDGCEGRLRKAIDIKRYPLPDEPGGEWRVQFTERE